MKIDIKKAFLGFTFVLSLYLFGVAGYIEILNFQAGNFLPRTEEYYNDDPEQGLVKWRYNITSDIKGLGVASKLYSNDNDTNHASDPNTVVSEQVPKSQTKLQKQAGRENRLHDAVIIFGLPQYPLLLISFICLFAALGISSKKLLSYIAVCFVLNILSLIALIGRNYFGSLGW